MMTGAQMKAALQELGWSQNELARRLHLHPKHVTKWAFYEIRKLPGYAEAYISLALIAHRATKAMSDYLRKRKRRVV